MLKAMGNYNSTHASSEMQMRVGTNLQQCLEHTGNEWQLKFSNILEDFLFQSLLSFLLSAVWIFN